MRKSHRFGLPLVIVVGIALMATGCKPPDMNATGGLVAMDRPAEPAAPADPAARGGIDVSAPPPMAEQLQPASPTAAPENVAPPPSIPIVANPGLIPVDEASSRGAQDGNQQPAGNPPMPASRGGSAFRLSAGVAVPQSLPMGTVMAMSVDYQIAGPLNNSSKYVWVVTSEGGGNVEVPLQPEVQGTLQAFFLQLRPEHRPFNCHIDEVSPGGRRTRVSNVATMQTSY